MHVSNVDTTLNVHWIFFNVRQIGPKFNAFFENFFRSAYFYHNARTIHVCSEQRLDV